MSLKEILEIGRYYHYSRIFFKDFQPLYIMYICIIICNIIHIKTSYHINHLPLFGLLTFNPLPTDSRSMVLFTQEGVCNGQAGKVAAQDNWPLRQGVEPRKLWDRHTGALRV